MQVARLRPISNGMSQHFSDPHSAVLQMGLAEGARVADLGSGTGHYARSAAGVVGPNGKVYAVDVQEDVLRHAKTEHGTLHHHHKAGIIEAVWGDIERHAGTNLREHSLDGVILANTLFQIENRIGLIGEIKRILKPGGKLLVVDWAGAYGGMGPTHLQVVPEHEAEALFINGGFHKGKSFRSGPHHYGIVFTAP
ncbi:MAG TPA: methyltransferase domain-containing protein [Candidatus Paceibacterota bacterium]|nr:methyltransferase domain-containing protein [Candidatus Paceibacterota bacterium]